MTKFTMAAITDPSFAGIHTIALSGSLEDHPGLDAVIAVIFEFTFTAEASCIDTVFLPSTKTLEKVYYPMENSLLIK